MHCFDLINKLSSLRLLMAQSSLFFVFRKQLRKLRRQLGKKLSPKPTWTACLQILLLSSIPLRIPNQEEARSGNFHLLHAQQLGLNQKRIKNQLMDYYSYLPNLRVNSFTLRSSSSSSGFMGIKQWKFPSPTCPTIGAGNEPVHVILGSVHTKPETFENGCG